jgi:exonuclease III
MTESITVLSFNLWNDVIDRGARAQVFIELVKQTKPDILCLQECTDIVNTMIYPAITSLGYVRPFIYPDSSQIQVYTLRSIKLINGVFKQTDIAPYGINKLPDTKMNRKIMHFTCKINMSSVTIATCHFESEFGKHNTIKHGQFQHVEAKLRELYNKTSSDPDILMCDKSNIILCGDFSIGGVDDGLQLSKTFDVNGWLDTWRATGSDPQHEITFNRETNPYNRESKYHSRLDRILYLGDNIQCTQHKVIAGFQDKQSGAKYVVSDHYGILAKFRFGDSGK